MRKILLILYYWPPAGGPGVQRWLYFVRYLPQFGVEPVLYLPENPHYPLRDPELEQLVPEGLKVYRSRFWEPYGLAALLSRKKTRRISSGIIHRKNPSFLERALLWIRGNLFIPDARRHWVKPALRELPEILAREGIDTVVTSGPPHSLHLIGVGLKERMPIRWVADFRDPWTEIGYFNALTPGKRARRRHRELESRVLGSADRILTTSRLTREAFERITDRPVAVVTNGYDGQVGDGRQPEGAFVLAHIGSLLSDRNPKPLWEALQDLKDRDPAFGQHLRLELTGLVSDEIVQSLRQHGLWENTLVRPYVPHREAMALQRQAQVLLLLEIDSPQTRGILPGKLFEYMAAARPVLAIGPEGWEAAALVEESHCGSGFAYGQQEAIGERLRSWYDAYRNGALHQNPGGAKPYHRRSLTEKLVKEVLWD